jgi:hypothetical protein
MLAGRSQTGDETLLRCMPWHPPQVDLQASSGAG